MRNADRTQGRVGVSCRFLGHRDTLMGLSVYVESLHGAR
jgi:hypothetical protein